MNEREPTAEDVEVYRLAVQMVLDSKKTVEDVLTFMETMVALYMMGNPIAREELRLLMDARRELDYTGGPKMPNVERSITMSG